MYVYDEINWLCKKWNKQADTTTTTTTTTTTIEI